LAELQRSGGGCGRKFDRPQSRGGAKRGALQPLRQPSRPRVRGRAAADASALLHQRRRDEFSARADVAAFGRRRVRVLRASLFAHSRPRFRGDERTAIDNRLISSVRFAGAVLDGPARLATVPGSEAARTIVRRLTRVSSAAVIGGWRRRGIIWRGAIIRRGPVVRRRRSVIGIRSNAEI